MKRTPLMKALANDDIKLAKRLIKIGTDVNTPDSYGWTPLSFSVMKGYMNIGRLIVNDSQFSEVDWIESLNKTKLKYRNGLKHTYDYYVKSLKLIRNKK